MKQLWAVNLHNSLNLPQWETVGRLMIDFCVVLRWHGGYYQHLGCKCNNVQHSSMAALNLAQQWGD